MLKINSNMDIEEVLHYSVDPQVSALLYPKFQEQQDRIVELDRLVEELEGQHEKAIEELAAEISNNEDTIHKLEVQNDELQYNFDEFVEQIADVLDDATKSKENIVDIIADMVAKYNATK